MRNGKLFYIMGASGSGKDTLLTGFLQKISAEKKEDWLLAKRYITRKRTESDKEHIPLSKKKFLHLENCNFFAMTWHANGLSYGVSREIENQYNMGKRIIINGSREYFPKAKLLYPQLIPVLITAPKKIIEKRLQSRGRENLEEITARLVRGERFSLYSNKLITIDNGDLLEKAIEQLAQALQQKN